jgi:hypothetical protein
MLEAIVGLLSEAGPGQKHEILFKITKAKNKLGAWLK